MKKQRMRIYAAKELEEGDRFYKFGDKTKTVFIMLETEIKQTQHRTYEYWAVRSTVADNPKINKDKGYINKIKTAIMPSTQVVFLKSKEL